MYGSQAYQSLLAYRQTPVTGLPYSPSKMLFSRGIREPLPCTDETLRPQVLEARELMLQRQDKQKEVHDRKARDLKTLVNMDRVLVRTDNEPHWTEGKILAEASQPRSYIVDTGSNQLRRNRTHPKSVPHNGNGAELEAAHSEVMETPGANSTGFTCAVNSDPFPSKECPSKSWRPTQKV